MSGLECRTLRVGSYRRLGSGASYLSSSGWRGRRKAPWLSVLVQPPALKAQGSSWSACASAVEPPILPSMSNRRSKQFLLSHGVAGGSFLAALALHNILAGARRQRNSPGRTLTPNALLSTADTAAMRSSRLCSRPQARRKALWVSLRSW